MALNHLLYLPTEAVQFMERQMWFTLQACEGWLVSRLDAG
jgi:hypothetical protein|nr:MAG TPA: hypothetical protein [Caudoviricetes sp.]